MRRRDVLATLAGAGTAGVAGCANLLSPDAPAGVHARVGLEQQDDAPGEHGVRIDAAVTKSAVTTDRPARVQVTVANEGPERSLSVHPGGCNPFNRNGGQSSPWGLWLYEVGDDPDRPDGDLWAADTPRSFAGYGCGGVPYASEEAVSFEYAVWDDARVPGYYTPGTYRWEALVNAWDPEEGTAAGSAPETFTWGFSLAVANDHY